MQIFVTVGDISINLAEVQHVRRITGSSIEIFFKVTGASIVVHGASLEEFQAATTSATAHAASYYKVR